VWRKLILSKVDVIKKERLELTRGYFEESSKKKWDMKMWYDDYFKNICSFLLKNSFAIAGKSERRYWKWNNSDTRSGITKKYECNETKILHMGTKSKGWLIHEFDDTE
jgi:hypothetical protein